MTANTNIRFEDWEAEQMKDPGFQAAVGELEPEYQAARERTLTGKRFAWRDEQLRKAFKQIGVEWHPVLLLPAVGYRRFVYEHNRAKEWEKACREWLRGCTCSSAGRQEDCEECTKAFHDHLRKLAADEGNVAEGENNMGQKTLMEKILMKMPKDPIKACPEPLCAGGLLWNEAVWDFGCQCPTCEGWGFVHDEAAEQAAEAEEFDEYEIYYRDELIAEVKDYRKGFESVFYDLSDTTVVQKPPRKS